MTTIELLTPAVRARAIAADLERTFADAHRETGSSWPRGCCVEASVSLRDELRDHVPEALPEYVWGNFILRELPRPWHALIGAVGHAWVELRVDGTILDITAGQFFGGPALWMLSPTSPFRRHYRPLEYGTS